MELNLVVGWAGMGVALFLSIGNLIMMVRSKPTPLLFQILVLLLAGNSLLNIIGG